MENIQSYAWACISFYERLLELEKSGFGTLVIPSRGVVPIEQTLFSMHVKNGKLSTGLTYAERTKTEPFRTSKIVLPFTADPPIDQVGTNGLTSSEQIRDFWVRVLKAILLGNTSCPCLIFYQHLLTFMLGVGETEGLSKTSPKESFVFADTVVSGRAVCEIDRAFKRHGLHNYHLVLFLDQNGDKLDSGARRLLERREREHRATLIRLNSLFTEDRGPGLTGTWCLSVPQLVEGAGREMGLGSSFVGAATSFVRVSSDRALGNQQMTSAYGSLSMLLHALIAQGEIFGDGGGVAVHLREEFVSQFAQTASSGLSPLESAATEVIAKNALSGKVSIGLDRKPIVGTTSIEVSSSHVIRLGFQDKDVDAFLKSYAKRLKDGPPAIVQW